MTRLLTIGAGLALALSAVAQAQSERRPAFDVASVRVATPETRASRRYTPGRVELVSASLQSILLTAFAIDLRRLSAPEWLADARVDIRATAPGATPAQIREMLETLLIQRFGLVTHTERRSFEVHELLVGSGGHKMREVEAVDELAKEFPVPESGRGTDRTEETIDGQVRNIFLGIGTRIVTSRSMFERTFEDGGRRVVLNAVRISIPELAQNLAPYVSGSRVIDRTGLTGLYQFTIHLPNDLVALPPMPDLPADAQARLREPTGLSVVKAVESLGLKLERRRVDLDVVVVDSIRREPTEN